MRNTWPCAPPASPSAPATDSSAGQSRSWHPLAPGSARKSARSGRARPSTCHYRGREKGASSGTIKLRLPRRRGKSSMRSEMRGADQWLRQHFNKQQHHHSPPPPPLPSPPTPLLLLPLLLLLSLVRRKHFSLSGPHRLWERCVGGDAVTSAALLCHSSTQGALGDIWTGSKVRWDLFFFFS